MEREGHVVVDVPAASVRVPTVVDGERVDELDRSRSRLVIDRYADAFETDLHEEPEQLPVVLRRFLALDTPQPLDDVVALASVQWIPEMLGCEREREPDGGHLHHALIDVVGARPPVLRALRIGAMGEAGDPAVPVVERPSTRDQWDDAPERSGVALQLGDAGREVRAERAESGPRATRRQMPDDRFDQVAHRPPDVVLGAEGVARQGIRPRVGCAGGHAILPRSSARTWCARGSPARKRPTSSTARSPIREISLPSEPAMWGVSTTLGRS